MARVKANTTQALRAARNLANAKTKGGPCGCFHIKPFNTHWDEKTVNEVMQQVQIYVNSWIVPQLEEALKK